MDWLLQPPAKLPEIANRVIENRLDAIGMKVTESIPDIAALGVLGLAAVLMVTGDGKWLGRIALVLWLAATWRMLA